MGTRRIVIVTCESETDCATEDVECKIVGRRRTVIVTCESETDCATDGIEEGKLW